MKVKSRLKAGITNEEFNLCLTHCNQSIVNPFTCLKLCLGLPIP